MPQTGAQPIRIAMIGGGPRSMVGRLHLRAIQRSGAFILFAGAFSRDQAVSRSYGEEWGVTADRCHADWRMMLAQEESLPPSDRCQAVAIAAPNAVHAPATLAALEAGLHVFCEKPLAANFEEASAVARAAGRSGLVLGVAYNYLAYPAARRMREMVRAGAIGRVRRIDTHYLQDWLADASNQDDPQVSWRLDPAQSGESGALADVGAHAFALAEYVCDARVVDVSARLRAVVDGRRLDDDATVLFAMEGGVEGVLGASQVCAGSDRDLAIALYGESGALGWSFKSPRTIWRRARGSAERETVEVESLNFDDTFLYQYADFAQAIRGVLLDDARRFAGIDQALRAAAFIRGSVLSHARHGVRVRLEELTEK